MKFTWRMEYDSGRILEYELTERELAQLKLGIIDFNEIAMRFLKREEEEGI